MAQLDAKSSGRIGVRALTYYMVTTILAALVGIIVVLIMHPGDPKIKNILVVAKEDEESRITTLDTILDIIRNMVPENLVQACFQQVQTTYTKKKVLLIGESPSQDAYRLEKDLVYKDGTNVMGMIMFCITFGLVAGHIGSQGKIIVDFFVGLNEIIMKLVSLIVMWLVKAYFLFFKIFCKTSCNSPILISRYSPFGIMCLIAGKIMSIENLVATAQMLGLYMVTVVMGLLIHGVITLPLIFWALTRQNPAVFFRGILPAWLTAMGTASR